MLPAVGHERRRDHLGRQPGHARRAGRSPSWCSGRIEPSGPPADLVRASTSASCPSFYNQLPGQHGTRYADLTQRRAVRVRRGAVLHDRRVRRPAGGRAGARRRRHRARPRHAAQHGRPAGAGDRAGLRPRHRHVGDLGRSRSSRRTGRWTSRPASASSSTSRCPSRTARWSTRAGVRIVEPGTFELLVGPSSRDEVLLRAGFVVTGLTSGPRRHPGDVRRRRGGLRAHRHRARRRGAARPRDARRLRRPGRRPCRGRRLRDGPPDRVPGRARASTSSASTCRRA